MMEKPKLYALFLIWSALLSIAFFLGLYLPRIARALETLAARQ